MNSRNHVDESAVDAGKRAALLVIAALVLTLPLQSQQSDIGDPTAASGTGSQLATAPSNPPQQVDQNSTAAKKQIEQPTEKSPRDSSTMSREGGPPAIPSSNT